MSIRSLFLDHIAQTSEHPLMLEVSKAEGMYIYDKKGKPYLDLNSGIAVSSLGHRHPSVLSAIQTQLNHYLHTMVYGEHIQEPQLDFAELLLNHLDKFFETIYYLNSGSEAVEAAIKLARKHTNRYQIISCSEAYHGSTLGAESLRSDKKFTRHYIPGIPGVKHIKFNDIRQLHCIDTKTSCVILEPIQAEIGVKIPLNNYLSKVKARCEEVGALMILDEIQTGFGRTGELFAHQKYKVVPDILLIGKSMGGGLPISGVVTSRDIMRKLSSNPPLGHLTTFGGNPLCAASAVGMLSALLSTNIIEKVQQKEELIRKYLVHPIIKEIRSSGLMMAVQLTKRKYLKHVISHSYTQGALIDYFLFNNQSFRLAPPLIINEQEIRNACKILLKSMDFAMNLYR